MSKHEENYFFEDKSWEQLDRSQRSNRELFLPIVYLQKDYVRFSNHVN